MGSIIVSGAFLLALVESGSGGAGGWQPWRALPEAPDTGKHHTREIPSISQWSIMPAWNLQISPVNGKQGPAALSNKKQENFD